MNPAASRNHDIIQRNIREDLPASLPDNTLQHHMFFFDIFIQNQMIQCLFDMFLVHLCQIAKGSKIHSKQREMPVNQISGCTKYRTISSQHQHTIHICRYFFRIRRLIASQWTLFFSLNGACHISALKILLNPLCYFLFRILLHIRYDVKMLHSFSFLSRDSCASRTVSLISNNGSSMTLPSGFFCKCRRYSIFPSGPLIGEYSRFSGWKKILLA